MQINVHAINHSYSQSNQQHSWLATVAKKGTQYSDEVTYISR